MSEQTSSGTGFFSRIPRWAYFVAAGVVAVLVVAIAVALVMTSRPSYYAGYGHLTASYDTLQTSVHKGLECSDCHGGTTGPVGYAARVGMFYRGFIGNPKEPAYVKLMTPTSQACRKCHQYDWSWNSERTSKVPHPAHLRVADEKRECVTCHRWTAHEESYMQKHKAMPFSTVCASFGCHVGWKTTDQCSSCHHSLQETAGQWKTVHPQTVRASGANQCLESCHTADQCRQCHTTGVRPAFNSGGVSGVTDIERAHVKKNWLSQHGTFALADPSKCLVCHVSEGECKDCHSKRPAFHGSPESWLGKHQPLAKKDKQRCLTCHEQKFCDACHKQFKEMQ